MTGESYMPRRQGRIQGFPKGGVETRAIRNAGGGVLSI